MSRLIGALLIMFAVILSINTVGCQKKDAGKKDVTKKDTPKADKDAPKTEKDAPAKDHKKEMTPAKDDVMKDEVEPAPKDGAVVPPPPPPAKDDAKKDEKKKEEK